MGRECPGSWKRYLGKPGYLFSWGEIVSDWQSVLAHLDTTVFRWINTSQQNAAFDALMPFVTEAGHWHVPILVSWTALLLFGGRRARVAALLVIPLLTLSDQASSNLIKNLLERPRPCATLADVHLLVGCSSSFSLPSSHAANFGAAALHLSWFYPRFFPLLGGLALLVGYSRVYVGVHYPFDVLVGFLVGVLVAALVQLGYRVGRKHLQARSRTAAVTP